MYIYMIMCMCVWMCAHKDSRSIAIIIVLYHYRSYSPVSQHIYTQPHSARPGAGATLAASGGCVEDNEVCPRLMWPFFRWGKWWKKNICTLCIGRVGNIRWITIGELLLKIWAMLILSNQIYLIFVCTTQNQKERRKKIQYILILLSDTAQQWPPTVTTSFLSSLFSSLSWGVPINLHCPLLEGGGYV